MERSVRIYLVGAHSTGKTTLARWIRDNYGLPMISEVARGVLAEMEAQLDRLRSDLDLVDRYQREVFERQMENEARIQGSFVSDRAFCNLAYAAHHSTVLAGIAADPRLRQYMDSVRDGIVFFVRPHRELVAADGVRAGLDWEEVVRIDGMVKLLLEMFAVPYIPLESLSMQERVRAIENVLALAGVPRDAACPDRERIEREVVLVPQPPSDAALRNGNGSRQATNGSHQAEGASAS